MVKADKIDLPVLHGDERYFVQTCVAFSIDCDGIYNDVG